MRKNAVHIIYHILVVVLSAALAFSLPDIVKYLSRKLLFFWSIVENEEFMLLTTEIGAAILLIVGINAAVRNWRMRKESQMAKIAGFVHAAPIKAFFERRRVRKLKEEQGFGRSVMLISSTGYRTFADPSGDLHKVLKNCREAKVMLLDPLKDGVTARAKSLADPEITPESFREHIIRSIDFLKGLRALQKNVRLKLYRDVPLLKLAILGDFLSVQHYPAGKNVRDMPEYVFKHGKSGNLFSLFYQYFVSRWFDPDIPEYDLDTDELVYRDKVGNEIKREAFNEVVMEY